MFHKLIIIVLIIWKSQDFETGDAKESRLSETYQPIPVTYSHFAMVLWIDSLNAQT